MPATLPPAGADALVKAAGEGFNKPTSVVGVLSRPAAICVAHGLTGGHGGSTVPVGWETAVTVDWGCDGLAVTVVSRAGSSDMVR